MLNGKYSISKIFEDNHKRANAIDRWMATGITPEEVMERWGSATPEKLLETARQYFPERSTGKYSLLIRDPLKSD